MVWETMDTRAGVPPLTIPPCHLMGDLVFLVPGTISSIELE